MEIIFKVAHYPDWEETWSRDSRYELILTRDLPSFDPAGERLVVSVYDGADLTNDGDLAVIEERE